MKGFGYSELILGPFEKMTFIGPDPLIGTLIATQVENRKIQNFCSLREILQVLLSQPIQANVDAYVPC